MKNCAKLSLEGYERELGIRKYGLGHNAESFREKSGCTGNKKLFGRFGRIYFWIGLTPLEI